MFKGKRALVVGGSGGIGSEISLLLSQNDADLVIHGSHQSEKFDSLCEKIHKLSGKTPEILIHDFFSSDFDDFASTELYKSAQNCDILCVCFGPFVQKSLHETSLSDWKKLALFDYALPGVLISAALPNMIKNHFGRILFFGGTGTSHRKEFSTNAAYAGAKSGLNVLVSSVAADYAPFGITCNAICPGFTKTEYISESLEKELAKKMPSKKMVSARSVAASAMFLLQNQNVNGAVLRLDDGWSALTRLPIQDCHAATCLSADGSGSQ